jgi:hypothetical protein
VREKRLFATFSRAKKPLEAEIKKEAQLIGNATRGRQTRCPKDAGGLSARTSRGLPGLYAKMLEPDYHKLRLLEIKIGRRYWQSNPVAETVRGFHVRVVNPLRQLQRRGVVERLQEITGPDDRTPIAVEIIGQVDLTKLREQWGRTPGSSAF